MTQMEKLIMLLVKSHIPFQVWNQPLFEVPKVSIPCQKDEVFSVVCNPMSYGHEKGLLEILQRDGIEDVVGWLTAEDVMNIIYDWDFTEVD